MTRPLILLILLLLTACGPKEPTAPTYAGTLAECQSISLQYGDGHSHPGVGVTIGAAYVWDGECWMEIDGVWMRK